MIVSHSLRRTGQPCRQPDSVHGHGEYRVRCGWTAMHWPV